MSKQVEISDFWVRLIKSPLYYVVVAFTGVSVSFCLLSIHNLGRDGVPIYHPFVLVNVAVIWLVFGFNGGIAQRVIMQIRVPKKSDTHTLSDDHGATKT